MHSLIIWRTTAPLVHSYVHKFPLEAPQLCFSHRAPPRGEEPLQTCRVEPCVSDHSVTQQHECQDTQAPNCQQQRDGVDVT